MAEKGGGGVGTVWVDGEREEYRNGVGGWQRIGGGVGRNGVGGWRERGGRGADGNGVGVGGLRERERERERGGGGGKLDSQNARSRND